jgi:cobalamin synthase
LADSFPLPLNLSGINDFHLILSFHFPKTIFVWWQAVMPSFLRSTAYAALEKQDEDDASSTETLMPMSMSTKRSGQSRLVWCSILLIAVNSLLLVILVGAVLVLFSTQRSSQQQSVLDSININSLLEKASGYCK